MFVTSVAVVAETPVDRLSLSEAAVRLCGRSCSQKLLPLLLSVAQRLGVWLGVCVCVSQWCVVV